MEAEWVFRDEMAIVEDVAVLYRCEWSICQPGSRSCRSASDVIEKINPVEAKQDYEKFKYWHEDIKPGEKYYLLILVILTIGCV